MDTTYTVKELIARVEGKIDVYSAQMSQRVESLETRLLRLETTTIERDRVDQQLHLPRFEQMARDVDSIRLKLKSVYVWGLVVLFAGSAAGQVIAKWLVV